MIQKYEQSMSPCVALETARYLTDPVILREYIELQEGPGSLFDQLLKKPKFRLFVLRLSRLMLFATFTTSAIVTITQMGRWNDIYFWLHHIF